MNQKEGNTFVLHVCCFDADPDIVKLLLAAGADLNLRVSMRTSHDLRDVLSKSEPDLDALIVMLAIAKCCHH